MGQVIQIVGGSDKGLPLEAMAKVLAERCKAVLCIGRMGPTVADLIDGISEGKAILCGDLARAVQQAEELAEEGDVVLLSPGFASYDQFANFEQRGEAFAKLAEVVMEASPETEPGPEIAETQSGKDGANA